MRIRIIAAAAAVTAAACAGAALAAPQRAERTNTLTMVIAAVPASIDPDAYQGVPSTDTFPTIDSTLLRYKIGVEKLPGPFGVDGFLVQSWKRAANGSYTFTLKNIKSASGNTITSEDVRWSFARKLATDPIARFLFSSSNIDAKNPITVVNPKTFTINVTAPSPLLLGGLTHYTMSIVDSTEAKKHATDADPWAKSWLATHTAAFAPYYVDGYQPGQTLFLKANPNWGAKLPFQTVVMKSVPDSSTRMQLVASGQADYTVDLAFDQTAELSKSKNVQLVRGPSPQYDVIEPNLTYKPFADARVRRALNLGIDRAAIVKAVYRGLAEPAWGQTSTAIPAPLSPTVKYDPAQARTLLAQAGYTAANPLKFQLTVCPCRPGNYAPTLAELVQSQLAKVGVQVDINVVASSTEFESNRAGKKYAAWLQNAGPIVVDPVYFWFLQFASPGLLGFGGGQNFTNYTNPQLDKLIALGLTTAPGKRRDRYAVSMAKILANDSPYLPIAQTENIRFWNTRIGGALGGQPNYGSNGVFVDLLNLKK